MSPKPKRDSHALDTARQMASQDTDQRRKDVKREKRRERLKPKMTWILIAGFIVVIAAASIFINWINLSLISSDYSKEMQLHQIYLGFEDSSLIASQGDEHYSLRGGNISRAMSTLSVSDHRVLRKIPVFNEEEAIYLSLSNGAKFTVAPDPNYTGAKDRAFIIYEHEGTSTYLSVEGYQTIEWLEEVIGPVGAYGPNQKVKLGGVVD